MGIFEGDGTYEMCNRFVDLSIYRFGDLVSKMRLFTSHRRLNFRLNGPAYDFLCLPNLYSHTFKS